MTFRRSLFAAIALILATPVFADNMAPFRRYASRRSVEAVRTTVSWLREHGFWIRKADPGFNQAYAALLVLKSTGSTATFGVDSDVCGPAAQLAFARY